MIELWPSFACRYSKSNVDPQRLLDVARAFLTNRMSDSDIREYHDKWQVKWAEEVEKLKMRVAELERIKLDGKNCTRAEILAQYDPARLFCCSCGSTDFTHYLFEGCPNLKERT